LPFIFVFGIPSATRQNQNASENRQTNLGSRRSRAPCFAGAPSFPWQLLQLTSVLTSPLSIFPPSSIAFGSVYPRPAFLLGEFRWNRRQWRQIFGGHQASPFDRLTVLSSVSGRDTLHAQRSSHRQECSRCPVKISWPPTMQTPYSSKKP